MTQADKTQPTRLTFGAFLKQYLKQSLQVFKHPKQLLPTAILTVVWMVLGILQVKVKENLPMQVLNFITYAQGGLYGGVVSAIGGILGKVVVAAFVNALIVPLFSGKKPFSSLKDGVKELKEQISFKGKAALAPLFKGLGAALLLYILFNFTGRIENTMAGLMAAVSLALSMGKKNGFLWNFVFSYANSVTKGKTPDYQNVLRGLTGMTLGFALGVGLTVVRLHWAGLIGLAFLIVGWILGRGSKKEAVTAILLAVLSLMPVPADAREDGKIKIEADFHYDAGRFGEECKGHISIENGHFTLTIPETKRKQQQTVDCSKDNLPPAERERIDIMTGVTITGKCRIEQKVKDGNAVLIYVYADGGYSVTPSEVTIEEHYTSVDGYLSTSGASGANREGMDRRQYLIKQGWMHHVDKDNIVTYSGRSTVRGTKDNNWMAHFGFKETSGPEGWVYLNLEYEQLYTKTRNQESAHKGDEVAVYNNGFLGYNPGWHEHTYLRSESPKTDPFVFTIREDASNIKSNIKPGKIIAKELKNQKEPEEKAKASDTRPSAPVAAPADDDEHADEVETIILDIIAAIVAALLSGGAAGAIGGGVGGAAGAALGGVPPAGSDVPPGGGEPLSPEELEYEEKLREYERWKNRLEGTYTRNNEDGTMTVRDPATGEVSTWYPKEVNGEAGWENENGSTQFTENGLDNWLDDRERNAEAYGQDAATAERNLAEWRAKNQAKEDYERKHGSLTEAEYKKTKAEMEAKWKKEDYIRNLADKYGLPPDDEQGIRNKIKKETKNAWEDYRKASEEEMNASLWMADMELVKKVTDSAINVGAAVVPGGDKVRDIYLLTKNIAGRSVEGGLKNGKKGFATGVLMGAYEGGMEVWGNRLDNPLEAALVSTLKEGSSRMYNGEDLEKTAYNMIKTFESSLVSNYINKAIDLGRQKLDTNLGLAANKVGELDDEEGWKLMMGIWNTNKAAAETAKETVGSDITDSLVKWGFVKSGIITKDDIKRLEEDD